MIDLFPFALSAIKPQLLTPDKKGFALLGSRNLVTMPILGITLKLLRCSDFDQSEYPE